MSESLFATATVVMLFLAVVGWMLALHWYYKYLEMEAKYQSLKQDKLIRGMATGVGSAIASGLMSSLGIGSNGGSVSTKSGDEE